MKEALYYKKIRNNVQCMLCPRNCSIKESQVGFCGVRKNISSKLYSLVYAKPVSVGIDPIEKKPLYHFLPGTESFSIGTVGCNLRCKHCQNWQISQAKPGQYKTQELEPEEVVEEAIKNNCKSISYTYNEPAVFYEYALDTAKIARKKGIMNVIVSNGFINEEPLLEWCRYMDAANIDLKGSDSFYRKITTAWLEPVQTTLKILKEKKVWFEITNLIIPTLNDNPKEIEEMCRWIKQNLGIGYPLHFTGFYPCYQLSGLPPTPAGSLLKAKAIAEKIGINYVYNGNVSTSSGSNTFCPKCREMLVERSYFSVCENRIKNGKCPFCGELIPGVWK